MQKFNRMTFADDGLMTYWTKYRTDLEIQQKQLVATAPTRKLILYTACRAPHDESTRKFNWQKFTDNGRTTYWMMQ